MKKSERKEMKSIKINADVHTKLLFLGEVFDKSVSDIINVMIDRQYPDAERGANDLEAQKQKWIDKIRQGE